MRWQSVAATPTYNPLGTALTFTSVDDICVAAGELLEVDLSRTTTNQME
jgi:hypothetical protein